ncbi:XRE family transcriptional regulator of biofilm formation [Salirhabdus euzebyi]|uniref:XRE family transcriptional regulator of biofilm formation n=1 Tax=Salirhabdus euzebyi TaxID=394506 RepID=A0A841Q5K4_9BACI|nr:helix-turn-helix domain-containing protein [Salirhabdus euzebyi]MBB6453686.1 XRE family transcriptional regulator of biofilm formation [Salirhabdus euzebyi]
MIGKKIKHYRELKGYSISELAKRSEISKSYLSNLERDLKQNPSLHLLSKIASTLDITVEVLIDEEKSGEDNWLDDEWVGLIKQAMEIGLTKKDFHEFQTYIKFKNWKNNIEEEKKL